MSVSSFEKMSISKVKDYWNERPCNIRHSPLPVGEKEYFDEVEMRKYFVEPHIPIFADFSLYRGKSVLEIGCGIGTDTINFARHGAKVTAVDISEESIKLAKKRAKVFGFEDQINFVYGNSENLSELIPPQKFDLIYSFGVIHHTPNPERVLAEAKKLLKGDGELKIMVYHRNSWKVFWLLVTVGKLRFWRLSEIVANNSEAQTGCPVTYIYSRNEGKRLINDQGFKVTDISVDHIFPYQVKEYNSYNYVKNWYFRIMPRSLFRWLERSFGWHLLLTAKNSK